MYILVHSAYRHNIEIRCDLCGQRVVMERLSEHKAGQVMRKLGWSVVESDGSYRCPQCKYLHVQHNGRKKIDVPQRDIAVVERSEL